MADDENGGGRKKPIPIRRTAGHARRTPREGRGREVGEKAAEESAGPTSVRESLGGISPRSEAARRPEAPTREFEIEGVEWVARVVGRTLCGTGRGTPKAPVMEIHFCRGDDPDVAVMRILVAGRTLEPLYDDEIRALFHRSRPLDEELEDGITLQGRPGD